MPSIPLFDTLGLLDAGDTARAAETAFLTEDMPLRLNQATVGVWSAQTSQLAALPQGRPNPPEGPYAGNGDVNVMYTGGDPASRHDDALSWQQWLHMSKNDMWGSDAQTYYPHLSAGRVGFLVAPNGAGAGAANGSVTRKVEPFPAPVLAASILPP
jgi:hypothetical protein